MCEENPKQACLCLSYSPMNKKLILLASSWPMSTLIFIIGHCLPHWPLRVHPTQQSIPNFPTLGGIHCQSQQAGRQWRVGNWSPSSVLLVYLGYTYTLSDQPAWAVVLISSGGQSWSGKMLRTKLPSLTQHAPTIRSRNDQWSVSLIVCREGISPLWHYYNCGSAPGFLPRAREGQRL